MKNYLLGVITTMVIFALFAFIHQRQEPKQSKLIKKEWVIAPRFFTLKQGVSKEEARKFFEEEWLPLYRNYPGFNAMLGEPIRSGTWTNSDNKAKEKGDFVLVYFFDSKVAQERYFTPNGMSDEIKKVIKENQSTWDALFGKYFVQDKYQMEEYLMFATAK
jgi:hypothetical protein